MPVSDFRLASLSTEEVSRFRHEGQNRLSVLIPVGSCEQHGPHLPLDTDTIIAEHLAGRASSREHKLAVGPSISVSASGEHQGFDGTISIGTEATREVLVELGRSLDWANNVVFVNGHGGNLSAVTSAVDRLQFERRAVSAWWPRITGGDAHAGRTETSMLLAIDPSLVRLELAAADGLGFDPGVIQTNGVRAVSRSGVLGDPTTASATHGRQLLSELTDSLRSHSITARLLRTGR